MEVAPGYVGVMLAQFLLWGAFFSLMVGSETLFALFGFMLVVFCELGVSAGSILGGLGTVLDASKPHLAMNAFQNHLAARRYVRSTSAASRRAGLRVGHGPYILTSAFINPFVLPN